MELYWAYQDVCRRYTSYCAHAVIEDGFVLPAMTGLEQGDGILPLPPQG
ncbi:MAG: hypothetical protein ACYSSI_14670 [Planctomycetota bacterium]